MKTQRKEPEQLEFDLVVVGGGMAGVCAAVAAARNGAKVAIVQDRPVFGGNGSSEIRVVPYGCAHSNAWTAETGIVHEIMLEDRATNHEHFFDHGIINSHFDLVLLETLRREPNISIYLNTSIRGVDSEALDPNERANPQPTRNGLGRIGGERRRITSVYGSQLGSEREFRFVARQFIDATGDGTVGFLAGADFRYGREAREEFNENLAPVRSDDVTMGSTITMRARDIGRPVPFVPPPWIREYKSADELGFDRKLYHISRPSYGGYWWLEVCNPYHQIHDNAAIRDELHRHVLGVWNYIKNYSEFREHAATYVLDWVGMVPGKRESRRLMGDVIVTEHDCHVDRRWPDGVCYAGWWIDLHIPGGVLNPNGPGERENIDANYKHWIRVSPFSLPLRAMYSRNVENLWMAGRCYSLTHVGLGPVRVQLSLGLQGQAVGTAAAYALRHKLTPRQTADPDGPHVQKMRQQLLREDVHVLGLRNTDERDLALRATASASSEMPLNFGQPHPQEALALDRTVAQVLPITADRVETVSVYLHNSGSAPVRVRAELQMLERIWDRTAGQIVAKTQIEVPPGNAAWREIAFNAPVMPNRPYRLILHAAPGVSWHYTTLDWAPVGTVIQYLYRSPGGPEEKNRHMQCFSQDEIDLPAYEHWRQIRRRALAVRVMPESRPYTAGAVNNGCAWPEDMPNLWISDPAQPLPQWVQLAFDQPMAFNTLQVCFDTQLDRTTDQRPELWREPECVRDWRVSVREGGAWRVVFEEKDNYQRRRIARFDGVTADAVRVEVLATNATSADDPRSRQARIYEIRVMDES